MWRTAAVAVCVFVLGCAGDKPPRQPLVPKADFIFEPAEDFFAKPGEKGQSRKQAD
jgi:hypothetical protein